KGKGNYAGEITRAYQITPRDVTLTSGSASKTYDGTLLTNPNVEVTGGIVNEGDVTYAAIGSITNAGSTANTIEVGYANAQMDANYDVTVVEGTLTVYAQSIDPEDPHDPDPEDPTQPVYIGVDTNSPSNVVYDGAAHQWLPTVTAEDDTELIFGTDYNVTYSTTDFTNVTGEIVVTITGAGNYAGEITRTYQITPRPVTLTSGSASKNYDGTALTNSEVTITSGSLVNASDVTYAAVGSITNVGSSLNRISVSYASEQMARNYVVTLVEGTLTVNTAPTTPTTPPTTPTTPPTTPGTPGTTTDDGATTDEPEVEEVEDEETPLSDGDVEEVEDNETPKGNNGIWALINLIAAIVTVILGLILLLSKRHRNDEEEDEEERQARIERGEEKEQEQKRGWICKVLGVIVAIASVVFFILTEDMSLPMALTDKWTIWMIVIAIVELVLVLVGRHWKDVDDEDQEQQA
ncbi:FILTED domain-containing surface protein, partial [Faecalitalea cylindroides]